MNEEHAALCSSPEWAEHLQTEVLSPLLGDLELGPNLIEVGPGPGAATDWLRRRVEMLTAVEAEAPAVAKLVERFPDVDVRLGDASALEFGDGTFDAAATFTMLHHVPTRERQDKVLAELVRVVRPGGLIVGGDSVASEQLRQFHEGDTYNPIAPGYLLDRLRELGCGRITVAVDIGMTFLAHKPEAA
ncbi:MAG TPA: class I SAM-dependent methyltransferase [Jatrophihabitantaceae bacterium]|jgi:ubiquinone/menaquinone biosynthesis C-methylase UbiE